MTCHLNLFTYSGQGKTSSQHLGHCTNTVFAYTLTVLFYLQCTFPILSNDKRRFDGANGTLISNDE